MLPVITVKEGKERKEGKKDITECYFFFFQCMCVCRGGGKKCVCVCCPELKTTTLKKFSLLIYF